MSNPLNSPSVAITPMVPAQSPPSIPGLPEVEGDIPAGKGQSSWLAAFTAGLGGWTLDAFDFFLVVLTLTAIGSEFGQSVKSMALALTATLALRPVGALLFGAISDRFGRRLPLIVNLCLFAIVELTTGFAHSFQQFLIVRALFGVVMGGQWGVGVSLAMEEVPPRYRGIFSGLLQQGYSIGFLLASVAYFLIEPAYGWRPLFYLGSIPALAAAAFVAFQVKESRVWMQNRQASFGTLGKAMIANWKLFAYLTLFMMALHMSSHGTQDLYPTFLEKDWGMIGRQKAELTAISMVAAILGGLSIGWISDHLGRRWAMIGSLACALAVIPIWAFSHVLPLLVLGAMLMQFFVQGAWGVVPAHVAELSPDSVRGTIPGLANQVGVLLSSSVVYMEAGLAKGRSYASAMAIAAAVIFCLALFMTLAGPERRAAKFGSLTD